VHDDKIVAGYYYLIRQMAQSDSCMANNMQTMSTEFGVLTNMEAHTNTLLSALRDQQTAV